MEETPSAAPKRELALVSHATYVKEKALQYLFFACAFLAVVTVILIFAFTTYSAFPFLPILGLPTFLVLPGLERGRVWYRLAACGLRPCDCWRACHGACRLAWERQCTWWRLRAIAFARSSALQLTCWQAFLRSSTASLAWQIIRPFVAQDF